MPIAPLELEALPGLPAQYVKALTKSVKPQAVAPRLEARVGRVTLDATKVREYRRVCGFTPGTDVPLTYPHVLAAPLHAALLVRPEWPYPLLGMVHVRQKMTQTAPLRAGATYAVSVHVDGAREAKSGREFDLVTRFEGEGARWDAVTTILVRLGRGTKGPRTERRAVTPGEPSGASISSVWRLPADLGRRYAAVSADYNPIHLTALTAKPFGFPRAIVHGMWTAARALAEIDSTRPGACTSNIEFRRPVLLPSTMYFSAHPSGKGHSFALRSREGTIHVAGSFDVA